MSDNTLSIIRNNAYVILFNNKTIHCYFAIRKMLDIRITCMDHIITY